MPTIASKEAGSVRCAARGKRRVSSASALRVAVLGALVASLGMAGCISLPFGGQPEALDHAAYDKDVSNAVQGLSLVFGQADESIKAVQQGWLAPEGAASEFGFLRDQVKDIKSDIVKAQPPPSMESFHQQLGKSVSLTQQAMDAMQAGFSKGDASYFDLAHQKLNEARTVLNRAVSQL